MADTDILLNVDLNVKDAEKTAQELQKEVENIFNSRQGESSSAITAMEKSMKETYLKAKEINKEMSKLADEQIATEGYDKLSRAMEGYSKQADAAIEKMSKFEESGGDISSQKYQQWAKDLEEAELAQQKIEKSMARMREAGTAFISGKDTEEYQKLQTKLDKVNDKLKQQIIHYREITNKTKDTTRNTEKLKESTDKVRKATKSATVETEKMHKATEKVKKATNETRSGFSGIVKYGKKAVLALGAMLLGARGLWSLFNKFRSALIEGFKNLRESGISDLKKQMNDLTNASNTLKNALAGAFAPIISTIIPYIQRLVEWLTLATDKIAQFIAAVSGQKTYIKAIKQVGDAAEKAGNQAKRALSPLDNLNVLTNPSGNGGGGFVEETISQEVIDKLDALKKKFEEIKNIAQEIVVKPFMEGFDKFDISGKFAELKKNAGEFVDSLVSLLNKVDKSKFLGVLQSASKLMGTIAGFVSYIALTLANSAIMTLTKFFERDGDRIVGHIDTINGLIGDIMNKVSDILEHTKPLIDFFDSDAFTTFSAAILGLITELTAGPLEIILTVIKDVLGMIDNTLTANAEKISTALQTMCEVVTPLVDTLKESFGQLWDKIKSVWEETVKPAVDDFTQTISDAIGDVTDWITENKDTWQAWSDKICEILKEYVFPILEELATIVGTVISIIIRIITQLWQKVIKPFIDWLKPYVLPVLTVIFNFITTTIKHVLAVVRFVLNTISTLLQSLNKLLQGDAKGAWNTLKDGCVNAVNKIKEVFGPFVDYIMGGFDKIREAFNGVKDFFSNVGTTVTNVFTGNKTTGPVNSKKGFASGGVIPPYASEHLIKVGDNHHETEIVSPLSTMKEAMVEALATVGVGSGNQEIILQLDGKTFMTAMVKQNNEYKKTHGGQSAYA